MVAVPEPVKKVFDTFPLKEYPAVENSTPALDQSLSLNRYKFRGTPGGSDSFTLGVFELFEYEGLLVPTDPLSLAISLYLCKKNNLKHPQVGAEGNSNHSLMKLPFQASPNNLLPVLVEDDDSRQVRLTMEVVESVNKLEVVGNTLLGEFLDTELYDLWLFSVYFEPDLIDLHAIFGLPLTQLTKPLFFESIQGWRFFRIRYPTLNNSVYEAKLERAKELLELLENDILNLDENNLIKVYAFVIVVTKLMASTRLAGVIPQKLEGHAKKYVVNL